MDLKKKLRGFFTLTRKGNGGFTLVELVVVIAILAILGGVAVPVYNGYIKKANQAADETLIAAINRAAAAAVLDGKGVDMETIEAGKLHTDAAKGKLGVSVWDTSAANDPVRLAFAELFAGNSDQTLKWYGSLKFDGDKFIGVESVMKSGLVVPDGNTVATTFNNSSYADLGVEGMTEMVDTLAGALSEYGGLSSLTETAAFEATLRKIGINPDTADAQTKANASVFYLADYIDQIGKKTYMVDGVAKTGDQVLWEQMKAGTLQGWLVDSAGVGLNGNDATFFNTALQYAAATAYAYSGQAPEAVADIIRNANPQNNGQALGIVGDVTGANTPDPKDDLLYKKYLNTGNGQPDFYAFFEVMEVVNASNGSFETFEGSSYFSNGELQAAIKSILGIS